MRQQSPSSSLSRRWAGGAAPPALMPLAIDPGELALRDLYRILDVLAAGAIVGEHVEQDEVGNRGGRFLADRAEATGRQRALGCLAEHRALGVAGPYRVGVIGIERVGQIADRRFEPLVEIVRLQDE